MLIDEYDQPIVKMLAQNGGKMDENVDANIRVLHEFFTALKAAFGLNGYCLFKTGVSKFSPGVSHPCPAISHAYAALTTGAFRCRCFQAPTRSPT